MASSGFSPEKANNQSLSRLHLTFQRLSEEEMDKLLLSLCNLHNWEKVAALLSDKVRRLNSNEMVKLIKRDNPSVLRRVRAFLQILEKDYPEITPELFADSLRKLLAEVSANNVSSKAKMTSSPETMSEIQRAQPISASLRSPLKELFQRFSKSEMNNLIETLSYSGNWEDLAGYLYDKTQKSQRLDRIIRLIKFDNNTSEECANAFLVFLQHECHDIAPQIFIDGLNQILLHKTANMVKEKMESAAPVTTTTQILKSVAPANKQVQSSIRLSLVLQKLTEYEIKDLALSLSLYSKWDDALFVLTENVGRDKMNYHSIIASIKQKNKTELRRAYALFDMLQIEHPEITAEIFIKTLRDVRCSNSASKIEEKMKELQQSLELPHTNRHSSLTVKKLLKRFSDEEMEKLLVDLCPLNGAGEAWHKLGNELSQEVKNSQLSSLSTYNLIESDNKTPFQRASIFLIFLQNECPEVTPEILVKALKKLSLNDAADLVERKMQENSPQHPILPQILQNSISSSISPLKELFEQLSENEMDTLVEALCPNLWKTLAKALSREALNNKLSDTKIKVFEYNNTSSVKSALALLRQLQEWPEITPQIFVDGLEQVLPFNVSNIVAKKMGCKVPPQLRLLQPMRNIWLFAQTPLKTFMQQFSWQEMQNLMYALAVDDNWRKLANFLIPKIQCGKLNPTKINLIALHCISKGRCSKKILSVLQECPEISPQDFVHGLEQIRVDNQVIVSMRAKLNSVIEVTPLLSQRP